MITVLKDGIFRVDDSFGHHAHAGVKDFVDYTPARALLRYQRSHPPQREVVGMVQNITDCVSRASKSYDDCTPYHTAYAANYVRGLLPSQGHLHTSPASH